MNPVIYTPRGAAREYAKLACNVYQGCTHGCSYCFGPNVTHKEKNVFLQARDRGPDFLGRVDKDAKELVRQGVTGQVHLCFTTDPYQILDTEKHITRHVIQILHKYNFSVAILTKGGTNALRDLDLFTPADAMAATMTFATVEDTRKEEPGAALPQDRWDALKKFHEAGIPTWISCEPVLDPPQTLYLIEAMHKDVDHVKVGKLNHDAVREAKINWHMFAQNAVFLLEKLGYKRILDPDDAVYSNANKRTYYVKSGLSSYLGEMR